MSNIFNLLQQKFFDDSRKNGKAPAMLECAESEKFALQKELNTSDHWRFEGGKLYLFNAEVVFIGG